MCRLSPKKLQRRVYAPPDELPPPSPPEWAEFEGPGNSISSMPVQLDTRGEGRREDDVISERSVMSTAPNLLTSPLSSVHGGFVPNRCV